MLSCMSSKKNCYDSAIKFSNDQQIVEFGDKGNTAKLSCRYYKHRTIDGIPIKNVTGVWRSKNRAESKAWLGCKSK